MIEATTTVCPRCHTLPCICNLPPVTQPPYALRDLMAMVAMHALIWRDSFGNDKDIPKKAYKHADAMLAERDKK